MPHGGWISKSESCCADGFAACRPDFVEAGNIRPQLIGFIDQQFAACLVAVEADERMFPIDDDHAVAQMGQLLRGLLRCGAMTEDGQKVEQRRVALMELAGIAQGDP